MFNDGFEKMKRRYNTHLAKVSIEFTGFSKFAVTKVQDQIGLLLTNIETVNGKKQKLSDRATTLRQEVGRAAMQWVAEWRVPKYEANPARPHSLLLPRKYRELEPEVMDEAGNEAKGKNDGRDDGDIEMGNSE